MKTGPSPILAVSGDGDGFKQKVGTASSREAVALGVQPLAAIVGNAERRLGQPPSKQRASVHQCSRRRSAARRAAASFVFFDRSIPLTLRP